MSLEVKEVGQGGHQGLYIYCCYNMAAVRSIRLQPLIQDRVTGAGTQAGRLRPLSPLPHCPDFLGWVGPRRSQASRET